MMKYKSIPDIPDIHGVPLPVMQIAGTEVVVSLDDVDEQRLTLVFKPYQAVRITTWDCFVVLPESGFSHGGVFLVENSPWLADLKKDLKLSDPYATFMEKSTHFVVPSGDQVLEVIAWNLKWNGPKGSGSYPVEEIGNSY
jgi:hypothetical protein